jgi:hypothetical protein
MNVLILGNRIFPTVQTMISIAKLRDIFRATDD